MVDKLRNKNVLIIVLVATDLRVQPKFMWTGKENAGVEEMECMWGSDSRVTRFPSKAAVGRLRRMLCDVECCRCHKFWLCILCLDLERISSFIILPSANRINFGLYFLPRRS